MNHQERIAGLQRRLLEQLIAREGRRHALADGAERDLAHYLRDEFAFTEAGELTSHTGTSLSDAIARSKHAPLTSYMFAPAIQADGEADVSKLDAMGRLNWANSKR